MSIFCSPPSLLPDPPANDRRRSTSFRRRPSAPSPTRAAVQAASQGLTSEPQTRRQPSLPYSPLLVIDLGEGSCPLSPPTPVRPLPVLSLQRAPDPRPPLPLAQPLPPLSPPPLQPLLHSGRESAAPSLLRSPRRPASAASSCSTGACVQRGWQARPDLLLVSPSAPVSVPTPAAQSRMTCCLPSPTGR
jgi:hypothetical protein